MDRKVCPTATNSLHFSFTLLITKHKCPHKTSSVVSTCLKLCDVSIPMYKQCAGAVPNLLQVPDLSGGVAPGSVSSRAAAEVVSWRLATAAAHAAVTLQTIQEVNQCNGSCTTWSTNATAHAPPLLLLKKVSSARLGESDIHPISPKTPAPQYQPIDRTKRKGKRVEEYSRDRAA